MIALDLHEKYFQLAADAMSLSRLTPEQALSGAPAQEDQRFRVPQILGEAE